MTNYNYIMKTVILIPVLLMSFKFVAQSNTKQTLDANKVSALINSNGILFQNQSAGIAAYEIPKGSGLSTFFNASIWIAGKDENDSLRVTALRYGQGKDFFPGPHSELSNPNQNLDFVNQWDKQIWKVSKSQIACHQSNYTNPNYIIPQDILTWPAHGDTSLGISANLAPFVDLDGNNIYSPENGEYPLIKGDEAVFYIMNDAGGLHTETNGLPLGIELHVMAYQFTETNSYLDSTTFINYKIINKGVHTFDSLRIAFYADADIGVYADDYYGCDVLRNMIYFYNGDMIDESNAGQLGYGENPPAAGVLSLNHVMNHSSYFNSASQFPFSDPVIAAQYFNFMSGKWANASSFFYGGLGYEGSTGVTDTLTNHMFPGQSDQNGTLSTNGIDMSSVFPTGWSELTNNNPPGDRRGYLCSEPFALYPSQEHCVDYAILYARSTAGTLLGSVDRLGSVADSCKQFYTNNLLSSSCMSTIVSDNNSYPLCNINFLPPVSNSYFGPKIKRIDGHGNGNNYTQLTQKSIDSILVNGFFPEVEYENGMGPIHVEIIDSNAYLPGNYRIEFIDNTPSSVGIADDSTKWVLYRTFNTQTTSYYGYDNILVDSAKIISELGLKIKIHQKKYEGATTIYDKKTSIIDAQINFSGASQWLTGVKDNDGMLPTNWIRSGDFIPNTDFDCLPDNLTHLNPCNYKDEIGQDDEENFENLLQGIIAPHRLTGYQSDFMPLAYYNTTNPGSARTFASISFAPSVDIVLTNDQSKWTRCPVIELGRDITSTIGNAVSGGLRQSPSVDKNGNPDGNGVGMGWFPGYAIDIESGARLYMAFTENSTLLDQNGGDMLWNPTSELFDSLGNPLFGGQHSIYIFGFNQKTINGFSLGFDFPSYVPSIAETNSGNFALSKIQEVMANISVSKREFYGSIAWIMNPLLTPGATLLENEAKIKIRVNKEYKYFSATNTNAGFPTYEWLNYPCSYFTPPIVTTSPSDSDLCNGTGSVTLDPSGSFTVEWSNGSQGVNGTGLCPGSVLVVATENTYGCIFNQYGFVDQVGSVYPLSVQLSVQDVSEDGLCDGSAQFFAYGGVTPYNYELYDANNTLVGSSENAGSLCSGVYQLILSDAVSNTDSIQFYVAEPSNFYSNVIISVDSTIMDTLVTNVLEECVIDFATVDTAWISAVNYINADTLVVTWVLQDTTGIHYVDQSYVITNFIGNYVIELSLFCPGKAPGDPYLKILSSLYVDYNGSSSGIDEWKDDKLIIYPNPSTDVIFIKSTGADLGRVILYDAQGKQIATEIQYFGDKVMLELPKHSGNYLIKIETLDGSYVRRVIKSQD